MDKKPQIDAGEEADFAQEHGWFDGEDPGDLGQDEFGLEDLLDDSDTEDADIVLVYADEADEPVSYGDAELMASDVLSEYEFEEIMALNELTDVDVVAMLFARGDIGLPSEIDEDVQGDETPEEDED